MDRVRLLARMRELCAEPGPDDGILPRDLEKLDRPPRTTHKLHRLGGQIQRAITVALGTSSDPVLRSLWAVRASPAPDSSRFCVEIGAHDGIEVDPRAVIALLHDGATRRWLRAEVAGAICRRRAPELVFRWALPEGGGAP